ncbi:hypothetical protein ACWEOR_30865, partial [Micromonospora chalcea]
LRVWNNPASGYNNKSKVLVQARAATEGPGRRHLAEVVWILTVRGERGVCASRRQPGLGTLSARPAVVGRSRA